ncbi:MAG: acyltransferase [Flavobacteriales bacterium]|nr:acyltransferase [Flavobacteriales bacterium]
MLELIQSFKEKLLKIIFLIFYASSFGKFGKKSSICFPFKINGAKFISIGNKVYINEGAWLLVLKNNEVSSKIEIGNGTYIGRYSHIVSVKEVVIGKNVLISDKVYISDNLHEYKDIEVPIKSQKIIYKSSVSIGENTWLGENTCVIGASVGKHCVIGANSVVTSNIPDYSIAVGSPAKVIKRYNHDSKEWKKC